MATSITESDNAAPKPTVCCVMLNYHSAEDTYRAVSSLANLAIGKPTEAFTLEVIVVNNDSPEKLDVGKLTSSATASFKLTVIQSPENLGFSGGCNLGMRAALNSHPSFVWFLNNDVEIDPSALNELLKLASAHPELGAISSAVCYLPVQDNTVLDEIDTIADPSATNQVTRERRVWYAGSKLYYPWFVSKHIFKGKRLTRVREYYGSSYAYSPVLCGCSLLVRVEVLEQVGGFDERHFLYGEDVDLCVRIKQTGKLLAVAFDSVVFHKVSQSSGGEVSPVKEYYRIRNGYFNISKYVCSRPTRLLAYITRPVFDIGVFALSFLRGKVNSETGIGCYLRAVFVAWSDFARGRFGRRPGF